MYAFNYHRPDSVSAAAAILARGGDAKLLAGGQTLIPAMKLRLASPGEIIDLGRVSELTGISTEGKVLVIGAMTPHAMVAGSAAVKSAVPALAELAHMIGDPAVRARGTIGGSIANNDPAADYPAACLGLGATIVTNKQEIAADAFFKGIFETALGDGEIITKVKFPAPEKAAYAKFPNPASRFALVGVFIAKTGSGVRVAVTGAGSNGVFRVPALEAALAKSFTPEAIAGVKVGSDGLNSDIHADAAYRAHLIGVMAKRAVAAAH
ncbi:MAG: xanthine dehydrogenase family protein subunit M [Methylobacteriaceae bacterium]|nr:xanthine dehydrogenase family protein subunit M [Methylobacteriaceae bacterium]